MRDYSGLVNANNNFPLSKFLSRHDKASQAIGYGKAAMLFHMLRNQIGDELFWAGLKKIAQEKMFQAMSWSDFAEQFSATVQRDLRPFFAQWLQRSSGPKLSLRDVTLEKAEDGYRLQGTLEQTAPIYQLILELEIETETVTTRYPIRVDDISQSFQFKTAAPPLALTVDPDAKLFRILENEEIPPTTNAVRGSTELLALKADKLAPSPEAIQTLLGALRKTDLSINNLSNISAQKLADHDLLFFGMGEEWKPEMLSAKKLILAGQQITLEGKSAFLILPHPTAKNRIAAWFISSNNSDDMVVARKIPHYGKYSYLVFAGGTNQLKGTFTSQNSPLRIEFN